MSKLRSVNPATGKVMADFESLGPSEVKERITRSVEAFQRFRRTSFAERARILVQAAELLEKESPRLGELMSREMGKLRQAGIEEAKKCARTCRYYAENGERFMADQPIDGAQVRSFVAFQPLGPVLAIMPWNFPFWQVFRFAAPALMAGNTALLKHASNVPQSAIEIESILRRAGLPDGVFQTLLIGSAAVAPIIEDPRIMAVTLTGSDAAGAQVASHAGKHLKKTVLELGGSDPFIVMPSVDLEFTVKMAVAARTINNGESCVAAKRFIVHEQIAEEFERRFAAAMAELRVGDPLDPKTEIGPLATEEIRDGLSRQVDETVLTGAKVLTGGKTIPGPGFYYAPTVLTGITQEAPAYSQEFFGPVALVFRAKNLEHAIEIANDNPFGLGSSFWSAVPEEQEYFVRNIEAGLAFVNRQVASDPTLPFGGIKRSGYGRELSEVGMREFVNIKTVVLQPTQASASQSKTE